RLRRRSPDELHLATLRAQCLTAGRLRSKLQSQLLRQPACADLAGISARVLSSIPAMTERHAMACTDSLEVFSQSVTITFPHRMAPRVCRAISRCQLGNLLLDEWQIALPRRRLQPQRARIDVRRSMLRHRAHELVEL